MEQRLQARLDSISQVRLRRFVGAPLAVCTRQYADMCSMSMHTCAQCKSL